MRRSALLISFLLVATACSEADSGPTTGATTRPTSTTTTSSPASSTTTRPIELPNVDVEDPGVALTSIVGLVDELNRNPQPGLLAGYYDPACEAYGAVFENLTRLAEENVRWEVPSPTEITSLIPVTDTGTEARIIVSYTVAADRLVDATGTVVGSQPAQDYELAVTLIRSDEYGWRVCESVAVIDP